MELHETVAHAPSDDEVSAGRRVRRRKDRDSAWRRHRCTMCQGANAFHASNGFSLMRHLVTMHKGQALPEDTIVQLRALGREACGVCGRIRALWVKLCLSCRCHTTTRALQSGDAVFDNLDEDDKHWQDGQVQAELSLGEHARSMPEKMHGCKQ